MSALPANLTSPRTFGHVAAAEVKAAAIAQLIGLVCFAGAALIYGLMTIPTEDAHSRLPPPTNYQLTPTPATAPPGVPDRPAAIVKGDIVPGQSGTQVITVTTVKSEIIADSIIARTGFGGPSAQTVVPLRQ
jgi:hypothetical protein